MIFAFIEDGTVDVLENESAARIQFEAIDVENRVVTFYSEDGAWLEPHFTKPNKRQFFGLVLTPGEFELVRNPAGDPTVDPFDIAVTEAAILNPNPYFESLEALRLHVQAKRCP